MRDDDRLAIQCRGGDPRALATLYRRHAPPVLEYLERILGSRPDAEDVLHETFLRIFQGRGRYEGQGRFRAWLFTVATHQARDRLKQRRRHDALAERAREALTPRPGPDPMAETDRRDILSRVESALADLPPTYATAFHLRVREAFAYREIASICGEPEGTIRSRVHHVVRRIRRSLQPVGAAETPTPRQEGKETR